MIGGIIMHYTIVKQWKTVNGGYFSQSTDYDSFDSAIGILHNMFLPMKNDTNVSSFVLTLMDENGKRVQRAEYHRPQPEPVEEISEE